MLFIFLVILSFFLSLALTRLLVRKTPANFQDEPNHRSLHTKVTPRSGGIAIVSALIVTLCIFAANHVSVTNISLSALMNVSVFLLLACVLVVVVGLIDDWMALGQLIRILSQVSAAGLVVFGAEVYWSGSGLGMAEFPLLMKVVNLFAIVWCINLYNFMDGIDGLAGGMALIGFGVLGALGYWAGDQHYAIVGFLLSAAAGGFLVYNYHPAQIFMGDIGSTFLGLLMAVYSLVGWQKSLFPLLAPIIIFSPFWIDATITLFKRMARKQRVWEAHQEHYYQGLVLIGFSHKRVALMEYVLMGVCTLLVVVSKLDAWSNIGLITLVAISIYSLLVVCLELILRQARL